MEKPENDKKEETDRRQDHARRLQIAIRRAHDPLFTPIKDRDALAPKAAEPRS
jgi:hypothetical protein